ncbi:uncharacterized membrane protein YjgN (DUF898 family) [Pacificibacter maritimus]|uniref:Uncharacterized membrane protein YjgN (DUF898 family) n=1 Tax=Pacificibacter maritimus TaxID=762213 RepID=A0A3N4UW15_9RHOB|nr:YjgN family protein [Pacificibacter maritimus]RPE71699.1 uncharacterized membrane protein YjgN (DUF898 family) [Pacificibacter maritimus]
MDTSDTFQVQFKGDAKTYFGIWIVNLLLTMVTLGIYSAWAKVRRKKYFAQNTTIDERRFDYHATGKQIFIGRLIVVGAYFVANILFAVAPIVGGIVFLVFLGLVPYLINRSLAFNARMTSFSGVRFGFNGSYWRAVLVFFVYPFLAIFTLYLALPFVSRATQKYVISRHRFGTSPFAFSSAIGPFYKAFLFAIGWMFGIMLLGAIVFGLPALMMEFFGASSAGQDPSLEAVIGFFIAYGVILVAILPAAYIYQAYLRNVVYAGTSLEGGHRFTSVVRPAKLLWIALSNAVVTACSWGLMHPWAAVRMARYLAASSYVTIEGSIDGIIGEEQEKLSALGDAFTDFEGIDVDFAI